MCSNQTKTKRKLVKEFTDAYHKVMKYLDEKFVVRFEQEQDPQRLEQLKSVYKDIGDKITKDYCKQINDIVSSSLTLE